MDELATLTQAIQSKASDSETYVKRAEYYSSVGQVQNAINDISQAIVLDSLNSEYYRTLSDYYLELPDGFNAKITMEKALRLFPQEIKNALKLAKISLILKDYDGTTRNLQHAKSLDPFSAEVEYLRGLFFLDKDRMGPAKVAFQAAVELDDQHLESWLVLGELSSLADNPETVLYYDNALRLDPQNISALHSKAFYIQNHDSIQQAIDLYNQVYELDPTYTPSLFNKAILLLEQDHTAEAKALFKKCTVLNENMIIAFYYYGICLEKQDSLKEAIAQYQQTIRLDSEYFRGQEAVKDVTRILRDRRGNR